MKIFSIFSVIVSTLLIGYFFIVGLPKIASLSSSTDKSFTVVNQSTSEALNKKRADLILRDKCNSYMLENTFGTSVEADSYLDRCMSGQETSSINVIKSNTTLATSTNSAALENATPRLTQDELALKCNDFMARAKFDSQKSADAFLKNCLAGK
jgi:hypothetical protein